MSRPDRARADRTAAGANIARGFAANKLAAVFRAKRPLRGLAAFSTGRAASASVIGMNPTSVSRSVV